MTSKRISYLVLPLLCLMASFAFYLGQTKTMAPVDIYSVSTQLYQPGNAIRVRNSYISDIVEVYLPWKDYLTDPSTKSCEAEIPGIRHPVRVGGVLLPQGACYPLRAVRHYIYQDIFLGLRNFFSFFVAYDLSYLLLLALIYLGFFYFLFAFLRLRNFTFDTAWLSASLAASLCAFSFPVARDLQYDGISQGLPWILFGLGFFFDGLREGQRIRVASAFVFLFLGITRSSLQILGFAPLFFSLVILVWCWRELRRHWFFWGSGVGLATLVGVVFHHKAIIIFVSRMGNYLPAKEIPFVVLVAKRLAALVFSAAEFVLGPVLFSFDTVDFSKVLNPLGGREYFSYDGNSYFMGGFAAVIFLLLVLQQLCTPQKFSALKNILWVFVLDAVVVLFPLSYKLFYFRFHQWWMLSNLGLLLALVFAQDWRPNLTKKSIGITAGVLVVGLFVLHVVVAHKFSQVLGLMGDKGKLGFEAGFWQFRLEAWLTRILCLDTIGIAFLGSAALSLWLWSRRQWLPLVAVVSLSGIWLNILYYNPPQPLAPFDDFRSALLLHPAPDHGRNQGLELSQNVNLLVRKPAYSLYESLDLPLQYTK